MKITYFERKLKNFLTLDLEIFGLDWYFCIGMRHPASSPLPCDPNRESPPSLITCKGEFLLLGSHCDTGTLTCDNTLKSQKIFFAKTYLRVLKHEENLF